MGIAMNYAFVLVIVSDNLIQLLRYEKLLLCCSGTTASGSIRTWLLLGKRLCCAYCLRISAF